MIDVELWMGVNENFHPKNLVMIMGREFDRNLFIMLLAIMIGAVIITYFVADLVNQSKIETATSQLAEEHIVEIGDINSKNENFTDNFLQGSVKMDSAREIREVGNYHFDLSARIWYPQEEYQRVINNCTEAMVKYQASKQKFTDSKPYFIAAITFTDNPSYIGVLAYYIDFANSGVNITQLRYETTEYLMYAAENLSMGNSENATLLLENFTTLDAMYGEMLQEYNQYKDLIDYYMFFEEDRTKPEI